MKSLRFPRALQFSAAASVLIIGLSANNVHAQLTKANNNDALTAASAWVENLAPDSDDQLTWNSTVSAATALGQFSFGSGQFTGGVTIVDPGGNIDLRVASNGTATLLNTGFIDMSTATVDAQLSGGTTRVNSNSFSPTATIAPGRTFTWNGFLSNQGNTKAFTMTGGGNVVFNSNSGGGGAMRFVVNGGTTVSANSLTGMSWAPGTAVGGNQITNGTYLANNTSGSGTGGGIVTVAAAGILGGTGIVAPGGTAGVNVSGIVAPGNAGTPIGTLFYESAGTTGNFSMLGGGAFRMALGAAAGSANAAVAGANSDTLSILTAAAGDVAFNNNNIDFLGGGAVGFYKLFDTTLDSTTWTGLTTSGNNITGGLNVTNLGGGLSGSLFLGDGATGDAGDIYLQVVPEPTSMLLLGWGAAFVLLRHRRRS